MLYGHMPESPCRRRRLISLRAILLIKSFSPIVSFSSLHEREERELYDRLNLLAQETTRKIGARSSEYEYNYEE